MKHITKYIISIATAFVLIITLQIQLFAQEQESPIAQLFRKSREVASPLCNALKDLDLSLADSLAHSGMVMQPYEAQSIFYSTYMLGKQVAHAREQRHIKRLSDSIIVFLLEHGYEFDTTKTVGAIAYAKPQEMHRYFQQIKRNWDKVQAEQRFADSISRLPSEVLNNDPEYKYVRRTIYQNGVSRTVIEKIRKVESEIPPVVFIDNQLSGHLQITLLTLYYLSLLLFILYKKYHISGKALCWSTFLVTLFPGILVWYMMSSILFNTNELITRFTGKQYEASVTFYTEEKIGYSRGSSWNYTVYHSTFHCHRTPQDSIYREIKANKTTFSPGKNDKGVKNVIVCLDEKANNAAVLIPWHTRDNIYWITVWSIVLILILLTFLGKFNKQLIAFSNFIEKRRKK